MFRRPQSVLISARGVAHYLICQRFWWLGTVLGYAPDQETAASQPILSRRGLLTGRLILVASALLVAAVFLLILAPGRTNSVLLAAIGLFLGGVGLIMTLIASRISRRYQPNLRTDYRADDHTYLVPDGPFIDRMAGLIGQPEALLEYTGGELIPVIRLDTPAPLELPPSLTLRASALMSLLASLRKATLSHTEVRFSDLMLTVEQDAELRRLLDQLLVDMRQAATADDVGRSHNDRAICGGCPVREICNQALP
jgi:hypothetical protein